MKNYFYLLACAMVFLTSCQRPASKQEEAPEASTKVVIAYVTSWTDVIPDPRFMSHINYSFGHVNDTFNGVRIDNEERLRAIVGLKEQKPELKVLLSIGGWGSGRFSEMAADEANRTAFAADCRRVAEEFGLDGIDIDWEYPTSDMAGISASPEDTDNFTLLMRDIRAAIGPDRLLTLATASTAGYIDFRAILPYISFVNVMAYDMAGGNKHHSALYPSAISGDMTSDAAVKAHLKAGVPPSKLVMGMPFYGRGVREVAAYADYSRVEQLKEGRTERWDDEAQVPYLTDETGEMLFGYENVRSIGIKCQYILDNDLLGGMYWEYGGDNDRNDLRATVADALLGKPNREKVLVLTERGGQHGSFTDAGLAWLRQEGQKEGFVLTEINNTRPVTEAYLREFGLIIQLDFPPYTWTDEAERAFIRYIDEGWGGWIGFHHATLLGEFDGYEMWPWFSDFMGGIRFDNYIAPLSDGTVKVEQPQHPVFQGLPAEFVIRQDEWYTYDRSPRPNVRVLASVDEGSYTLDTDIKMGDHPVVWTNEAKKARNVYFQFGHGGWLYDQPEFTALFHNAIRWGLGCD